MRKDFRYSVTRDRLTGYWVAWFDAPGVRFENVYDSEPEAMHAVSEVIRDYKENN